MNVEGISERHTRIWRRNNNFLIQNISDTRLVIIDGKLLQKKKTCQLKTGTKINFGAIEILFTIGDADKSDRGINRTKDSDRFTKGVGNIFKNLIRNKKRIGIWCGALGVIIAMFVAVKAQKINSNESNKPYPIASSEQPVELPAKGKYGYIKNNDRSHPDKAVFTFASAATNLDLHYSAGGIDSEKEVSISLNGQQIGYAPLCKGGWGDETVVRLPKNLLRKEGINSLVFDNTENPPKLSQWAVKNIWIKELAASLCDEEKAQNLFELGEELYEQKSISKGNLFMAYRYYCDTITHLQDCSNDLELLRLAESKKDLSMHELDVLYNGLKFAFMKAHKVNDYKKCKNILQNMVQHIPDKSDERYQEAAKKLEEYERYFQLRRK
jgi:hypothetical protein